MPLRWETRTASYLYLAVERAWPTDDEAREAAMALAGAWSHGVHALTDLCEVNAADAPTFAVLFRRVDAWVRLAGSPGRVALLARVDGLMFAQARMLEILAKAGGAAAKSFTDEAVAIAWMLRSTEESTGRD